MLASAWKDSIRSAPASLASSIRTAPPVERLEDAPAKHRKAISVEILLLSITVITTLWLALCAPTQAIENSLPTDVGSFIGRRASCQHWSQNIVDPSKASEIMRGLKCEDIKGEEQVLRKSYADNPAVIAALNATSIIVVQRAPVRRPVPTPSDSNR
jgi:hypothetical protein